MGFYNFFKKRSSIGVVIGPQSVFTAFRALLPSANYSAEWSGHFNLQRAVAPDWMGRIALWGSTTAFFSRAEKPSWEHNTAFITDEYKRVNTIKKKWSLNKARTGENADE
jgi:hypothetical protein